jgi:hypothetical protein
VAQNGPRIKDLWPIGVLLLLVAGQIIFFTPIYWQTILLVISVSYGQNISFTLASRARTRNNVSYHLCAVLLSTLVSFLTFRTILGPGSNFSLKLLLAYTTGTISGSLTGSYISMWIEHLTDAVADETPASKEIAARNQKKALRYLAVITALGWSAELAFGRDEHLLNLLLITALVFLPDMLYSMRTWIQNRNNDYLTLGVSLLNGIVDFFRWSFLIKFDMRWGIFVPYSTGSTAGSITGSLVARGIIGWIEKKTGIKVSADAHVKKGEMRNLDYRPIMALLGILAVGILAFPPKDLISAVPFVLATLAKSCIATASKTRTFTCGFFNARIYTLKKLKKIRDRVFFFIKGLNGLAFFVAGKGLTSEFCFLPIFFQSPCADITHRGAEIAYKLIRHKFYLAFVANAPWHSF